MKKYINAIMATLRLKKWIVKHPKTGRFANFNKLTKEQKKTVLERM